MCYKSRNVGAKTSSGRRDRKSPHLVLLDQAGDEAGSLRLLHKVSQEGGACRVALLRADSLLYGGELAVENAGAGKLFHIRQKSGTQASQCLQPLITKLRNGAGAAFDTQHGRMLDIALQP